MVNLTQKAGKVLLGSFQRDQELITARNTAKEAATTYDKIVDQLMSILLSQQTVPLFQQRGISRRTGTFRQ
jgi:hypothetical protein